jgi:hypothetical protein
LKAGRKHFLHTLGTFFQIGAQDSSEGAPNFSSYACMCPRVLELATFTKSNFRTLLGIQHACAFLAGCLVRLFNPPPLME